MKGAANSAGLLRAAAGARRSSSSSSSSSSSRGGGGGALTVAMSYNSGIPPTKAPSRLIVPGSPGYADGVFKTSNGEHAGSRITMPGQAVGGGFASPPKPGVSREAGTAFAPFRPPSQFLDPAAVAEQDTTRMLMLLRQRGARWYELAPLIPVLMKRGMMPDEIFDETGVEPREQSLWLTWTSCRGSLVTDPAFPEELLGYFDDEYVGAPTLSVIMYFPSYKRTVAAEYIVSQKFNLEQAQELFKAYEIRLAHDTQARGFGSTPGEIMAFKLWRDAQELQRYQGVDKLRAIVTRGKRFAESDTSRQRLDSLIEMWEMDLEQEEANLAAGGVGGPGGSLAKAQAEGKMNIAVVRLDRQELGFRAIPVLGDINKVTGASMNAIPSTKGEGVFGIFNPKGSAQWVALPNWDGLSVCKNPFAVSVSNTAALKNSGVLQDRQEPALLIVDRGQTTPSPSAFYLAAKKSTLMLAGMGGRAKTRRPWTCTRGARSWTWRRAAPSPASARWCWPSGRPAAATTA